MTTAAFRLVVALAHLGHPADPPHDDAARARHLAAAIIRAAGPHDLDVYILAALIARESRFNAHARSADGQDLGLLQIRRGGAVTGHYLQLTDAALMQVPINLALGVAYLAKVRARCGGPPEVWLSAYSGRACRPSKYSRAIVRAAEEARAAAEDATREPDGPETAFAREP